MKKNYFFTLLLTLLITALTFSQDLVITGVFDGSLSGGTPKGVELYVLNDIADLSIYGIGSANNGQGTDGEEFTFPADAVTSGTFIYISTEAVNFKAFFGIDPTYTDGSMAINGDDAVELFMNGNVVDLFGDIDVDGNGEVWEYLDGWAYRKNGKAASTTFTDSDWTYSGPNALDGESTNASAKSPFPIGSYSAIASTVPSLSIQTPKEEELSSRTSVDVKISVDNFNVAASGTGDGYIKYNLDNGTSVDKFDVNDFSINVTPGVAYVLNMELVDNSGNSLSPAVTATVNFSIAFPCDIQLSTINTVCDAVTSNTDTYTTTLDFSGGNTGILYTITAKDNGDNDIGTISGDNPNTTESGQIKITGVPEGTDFTIKVVGGTGSSCDLSRNINAPSCLPSTCAAVGSVIITEIMQNPAAVSDDKGEYFEVYNTTSSSIDLQGWVIKAGSTTSPNEHTISTSVVIPANGYVVFGENSDDSTNGGVTVDYQYDSSLYLGNGSSKVVVECGSNVIDEVTYDNGNTFPDPTGKSMELATNKYSASENDNGANWAEATSEIVSGGDLGTPGKANDFVLSLDRNSILGFATYPNPITSKSFTISSSSSDLKEISIFNVIGKKVFATSFSGVKKDIDVSSINAGVYILKVTEAGKTATKKLVIR